jgi:hypothetical protein
MSFKYPKNIHPLVDAACQKEENEYPCKSLYYSMKVLKSVNASEEYKVKTGVLIGGAMTVLSENEKWSHHDHMSVVKGFFSEIEKFTSEDW